MIRSLCSSTALLTIILLMSAGTASARTGGVFASSTGSATQLFAIASSVHQTQFLNIWALPIYTRSDDGYGDNGKDRDKDKDKDDKDKDDHAPKPAPEPSTILSFGVALLVGGGVLLSRRLLGNRK